jgi:putative transcriptional regulator
MVKDALGLPQCDNRCLGGMSDDFASEERLAAYAAGTLAPGLRLLMDTRAAMLVQAAFEQRLADGLAGDFFSAETPSPLADDALEAALAAIDAVEVTPALSSRAAKAAGSALQELLDLPEPLREIALEAAGRKGWKFAGPGLRVMALDVGGSEHVDLLRIEPGHGAPRHDHEGAEYTLVLTGAFADERGRYTPGDISVKQPGEVHRPIAQPGEVCFALAVTEGPLAFKGALGLVQRLFTRH